MIVIAPMSEKAMTYANALLYCQFFEYNGCMDWRLPTKQEWFEHDRLCGWYEGRQIHFSADDHLSPVTPVRDVI